MRYANPDLIDQLAATYVLGTLRGPARRRFERLMSERHDIQDAVWRWERQLLPMAGDAPQQTPAASVWASIERRLGFTEDVVRVRSGAGWWQVLSGAALTALLVVIVLPIWLEKVGPVDSAAERLALIQDSEQQPLWVVTVDEQSGQLRSVAVNAPARDADRVFELWMLPQEGPPQSFGLLPASDGPRALRQLSPTLLALLANAKGLAVSIEPPGGSPTGVPTGPVVYVAPVIGL